MPHALLAPLIGAGASLVGGLFASHGAKKAGQYQADAANQASQYQQQNYQQTRQDLSPFRQMGMQGGNMLMSRLGDLSKPFNMTQANLEQTPGYQFNLSQGLKSVNNAMGARGLFNSGAVMKGASEYATGLADNTYGHQFDMYQQDQNNAYNKLLGVATLGENAAAQTGDIGSAAGRQVGDSMNSIGQARAAGAIGQGNAFSGIANTIGGFAGAQYMHQMYPYGGYGGQQGMQQYGAPTGVFGTPQYSGNALQGYSGPQPFQVGR